MKIAILGTRGIPNNYGGFEQLAQYLSLGLKEKGHEVYVYSSDTHPFQENLWQGIHLIHQYDPEKKIGTAGQFIYDLNCILNTRKQGFDVILNLGYTSSAIWLKLFPKRSRILTNMDGMEWKRTKFSKKVQRFLMYSEKLAVRNSQVLIADSLAIQAYLLKKYKASSHFIAYGADLFESPDEQVLLPFACRPFAYNLLIARMEPENNIDIILEGVQRSASTLPFFVVGNQKNTFGSYLAKKYKSDQRIVFMGPVYENRVLNNLRYFCNLYFHGHSVGGTNPSLLEAMACRSLVAAHQNEFNASVLGENAFYFTNPGEVARLVERPARIDASHPFIAANYARIKTDYSWEKIINAYESIMLSH